MEARANTPDRLAILLSNFHPQAEDSRLERLEREEDQVSRLGRDFLSSTPPWYGKRLGSALATGVGSLKVQLKHEITRLLSGLPPDPVVFLLVTGHGVFDETEGPALIARDVYLHWKEDGLVPLSWFVESLGAAVPRHAVIVFDVQFIARPGTRVCVSTQSPAFRKGGTRSWSLHRRCPWPQAAESGSRSWKPNPPERSGPKSRHRFSPDD